METMKIEYEVNVLSETEFGEQYPQYKGYAQGAGKTLFALVMTPESLIAATVATKMGLPAVAIVAEDVVAECQRLGRDITPFDKQFVGAVVCSLMQANGFSKTGTKRAVPNKAFSKAEFYVRQLDNDSLHS